MTTSDRCPYTEGALWTWAGKTAIRRHWTEGFRADRQDVYLLDGPWGVRVLDTFGVRWVAYTIPEAEVEDVESALTDLHKKRILFNAGAVMDPEWAVSVPTTAR